MYQERKRWLGWLLAGFLLVALIGGFAFYRPFQVPAQAIAPAEPAPPIEPAPPPAELTDLERQTILLMGIDNTDGEWGRTDSLMVISYDPRQQRLAMLSIPRDTWALIPGHGYDKVNHAYAYGGHTLAIDTVQRLLGITIDHWITLSFDGFTQVIDALGGIEVDVPERMLYTDPYDERMGSEGLVIDIQPGLQIMDGETALKYARFRADAEGDIGRMRRQQEVIAALAKKASSPALLTRAPQLITALYSTVGTDLSVAEMITLATSGREAIAKPLITGSIEGEGMMLDGVFYYSNTVEAIRTRAYEVLVGEPPDEEFLRQARQEQENYDQALEQARAQEAAAVAAAEAEAGESASDDEPPGEPPGTPPGSSEQGQTGARPRKQPAPKPETITVALIDGTGRGVAREYLSRLRAAGFRVARLSRSSKVIKSTLVVNHGGAQQVEERLRQVLPHMLYAEAPDPKAEQAVEILLGTDLLEWDVE